MPTQLDPAREPSSRAPATASRMLAQLAALAIAAFSVSSATAAPVQTSFARDPFARIIARADAVALGRVLEAGIRDIPDGAGGVTDQAFVRMAVERWIAGPDTNQTLEVKLSPYDPFLEELDKSASQPDRRVVLYLVRAYATWWLVREVGGPLDRPVIGLEVLPTGEALHRIPAIRREAEIASPESLATQADLVVVGSLSRHAPHSPGVTCRVERVIAGALIDSTLTVVTATRQDLHRGRALLLLVADSHGMWQVLDDGAGCYFLNADRVAHSAASAETVFARIAAAHARRVGRTSR